MNRQPRDKDGRWTKVGDVVVANGRDSYYKTTVVGFTSGGEAVTQRGKHHNTAVKAAYPAGKAPNLDLKR